MSRSVGNATLADHFAAVAHQRGVPVTKPPSIPDGGQHIWRAFREISRARGGNGFGPNPLAWTEIDAWARLTGTLLEPWEVRAIREIDDVILAESTGEN